MKDTEGILFFNDKNSTILNYRTVKILSVIKEDTLLPKKFFIEIKYMPRNTNLLNKIILNYLGNKDRDEDYLDFKDSILE